MGQLKGRQRGSRTIRAGLLGVLALAACNAPSARVASPTPIARTAEPTSTPTATDPAPTDTPTLEPTEEPPPCELGQSQRLEGSYQGVAVARTVPYVVYLPACYEVQDGTFPTIYLLHGHPYDQTHWERLGLLELLDDEIAALRFPSAIVVMPLQPDPLFRNSDGGPGSYETELLEGLLPHIEAGFRADPARRSLAGISRGGVWALEIGLSHPERFQMVAGLSPALAVNSPRPLYDPFEIVRSSQAIPASIVLLAGEQDWARPETERLSALLNEKNVEQTFLLVPGDHSDATWKAALATFIEAVGGILS